MTRQQINAMQARIGAEPDGWWGPKSIAACQRHLRAMMPTPNPWPRPDLAAMKSFYGDPGDVARLVNLPVIGLGIKYAGQPVRAVRCHERVAESLGRVLRRIAASEHRAILDHYAGCYNYRPMRGGSTWSKHAWGAAIDLMPATNGNHTHWPTKATMPLEIMEAFALDGWLSAGAFWARDAMHFQATR
jgi:hypothetical protein